MRDNALRFWDDGSRMKINVVGASGAGTTTLALALADALPSVAFDADAYYWEPSDPPFARKVKPEVRQAKLWADVHASPDAVVAGSMSSWGSGWQGTFDLVVFLRIPAELRMERLAHRERERYGTRLDSNLDLARQSSEFLQWARGYDDPSFDGKSITRHEQWMAAVGCPVLRIEGDTSVADRVARVQAAARDVRSRQE